MPFSALSGGFSFSQQTSNSKHTDIMKHLLLIVALFVGVTAWGQSVGTVSMTLSGTGGSGTASIGTLSVSASGEGGSMTTQSVDILALPPEVATALEEEDIEDVSISIRKGSIEVNAEGEYTCNIYDVQGKLVAMQNATKGISLNLNRGIYVVSLSRQGKVVMARKIIVK